MKVKAPGTCQPSLGTQRAENAETGEHCHQSRLVLVQLRFRAEGYPIHWSILFQALLGFSYLPTRNHSCSFLTWSLLADLWPVPSAEPLCWTYSCPAQKSKPSAGTQSDLRYGRSHRQGSGRMPEIRPGSCGCHLSKRQTMVTQGDECAPRPGHLSNSAPDMRLTQKVLGHRVHWCQLRLRTGENPSMCLKTVRCQGPHSLSPALYKLEISAKKQAGSAPLITHVSVLLN